MTMTATQVRLNQNPILTGLLLGMGQGIYVAEKLFPRLPSAFSGVTLPKIGDAGQRKYELRRAPGAATKRVNIKYEGQVYTVNQYSVEVPIPREVIRESDAAQRLMNVGRNLDVSRIAMVTASDILALDYEIECATLATTAGTYASGHVQALTGGTKWSAATGTPVDDIEQAAETIRQKTGKRPNTLTLSAVAWKALRHNAQVRGYLPSTQQGPATIEQLKNILNLRDIVVGDAIWIGEDDVAADVWGNHAVLSYVPLIAANGDVSLAEPAFGFTNVIEGHPFAETPYYEPNLKSYVYGATFERQAHVAYKTAGFLFQNPN